MPKTSLSLFFVADGQNLEKQSWLLSTSLFYTHEHDPRVKLFAYTSPEYRPQIAPSTHAIYEACGVQLRDFPISPKWKKSYPHGNKIIAACDDRGTSHSIFLDTDVVCMRSLAEFMHLPDQSCSAAPEGRRTWGGLDRWERAYAHFGLDMPSERVRLLRGRRSEFVPYFNAGLVAFSEAPHPKDGQRFPQHWLDTAMDFDHNCGIANKRPWLDQITFPLTTARFDYNVKVLDETHNYSLSKRDDYSATPDVAIIHYHRYRYLARAPQWPSIKKMVRGIIPTNHHVELEKYLFQIDQSND